MSCLYLDFSDNEEAKEKVNKMALDLGLEIKDSSSSLNTIRYSGSAIQLYDLGQFVGASEFSGIRVCFSN